jgi:hypothetical protein
MKNWAPTHTQITLQKNKSYPKSDVLFKKQELANTSSVWTNVGWLLL